MKTAVLQLYTGFAKTKAVLVALVLSLYLALVAYSGGSLLALALVWLALAAYIVLPGMLLARVGNMRSLVPGFGMPVALLLGSGFFAALFCFCQRLGLLWLARVLPPLLAVACLILLWREHRGRGLKPLARLKKALTPNVWLLVLLVAFLVFVYTFAGVVKSARPSAVGDVLLNHDLLWNAGNAESFGIQFPPQDIRFYDVRLHYHYLTELLAGGLAAVLGLPAYDILAFYMQPPVLAALVLCLYRFGRVMWPGAKRLKPMLFTFSMFLFSCASLWKILPNGLSSFWNSNLTHLITNINAVSSSVIYLCIFLGLLLPALRAGFKIKALHGVLLAAALFMLIFAKGPLAGLVVVALALAMLVALPLRQSGWRQLVFGALAVLMFWVVYTTMFSSGANDSMMFSLYGTLEKGYFYNIVHHFRQLPASTSGVVSALVYFLLYFAQSWLMVPAAFPLYLRGVGRDVRHFTKLTAERLLFNAAAVGGLLAFFLFNHPSMSQVYFAFGGFFFIYLLAVDNIDMLRWPDTGGVKAGPQKGFVAVCAVFAAVAVATSAFLYVHHLGSGARQLLRNWGVTDKYPYAVVVNADDEAAAGWLRENAAPGEMFATNRIHTGGRLEGISNLYSGLSGRQAFMEGFQYAKTNMGVPEAEIERRLAVNGALFDDATDPAEVERLMRENGITYLLFTEQMGDQFEEYYAAAGAQMAGLELVFDSETARIYKLA